MPPCRRLASVAKKPITSAALVPMLRSSDLEAADARFPVPAVEAGGCERADVDALEAADVHVDVIGVRAGHVERRNPAVPAELVLRGAGTELVERQVVGAREQPEALRRDDQVQVGR